MRLLRGVFSLDVDQLEGQEASCHLFRCHWVACTVVSLAYVRSNHRWVSENHHGMSSTCGVFRHHGQRLLSPESPTPHPASVTDSGILYLYPKTPRVTVRKCLRSGTDAPASPPWLIAIGLEIVVCCSPVSLRIHNLTGDVITNLSSAIYGRPDQTDATGSSSGYACLPASFTWGP